MIRNKIRSLHDAALHAVKQAVAPQPLDPEEAYKLAKKLLGKPVGLATEYVKNNDGQTVRKIAWRMAGPQVERETQVFAGALQFLIAEGYALSDDEEQTLAMARAAVLWWHGIDESQVEDY
jgi:hypothetical protein